MTSMNRQYKGQAFPTHCYSKYLFEDTLIKLDISRIFQISTDHNVDSFIYPCKTDHTQGISFSQISLTALDLLEWFW